MKKIAFDLTPGEQVIKDEMGMFIKSKLHVQPGQLVLTNKRFVFVKNMNFMFGLIGLLFKTLRGGVIHDIPLENIKSHAQDKFGVNTKVMKLTLSDGQELRFVLNSPYEEWASLLKN
jgi:hypothetical protein